MSIKIRHIKGINEKNINNFVLFSDDEFKINGFSKLSLNKQANQINRTINSNKSKKKRLLSLTIAQTKK